MVQTQGAVIVCAADVVFWGGGGMTCRRSGEWIAVLLLRLALMLLVYR
jgi:hypothetical protein